MKNVKLVLTDVDGTLVPLLGKEPSQAVIDIAKRLQDAGIEVAPVTGRPYDMAKDLFAHIGFHDYGVFDAGASVRKVSNGEVVWKQWLSVEQIKHILGVLLPVSSVIDYFPDFHEVETKDVVVDDISEEAPYVFAFVRDTAEGAAAIEKIKSDSSLSVNVHYAHEAWEGYLNVQITDVRADKYHGVMALQKIVDVDLAHTLAIGDSGNDIPLFQAAGLKIAMGNAIEELKNLADHTVASVDDDGFVEAMKRFVL